MEKYISHLFLSVHGIIVYTKIFISLCLPFICIVGSLLLRLKTCQNIIRTRVNFSHRCWKCLISKDLYVKYIFQRSKYTTHLQQNSYKTNDILKRIKWWQNKNICVCIFVSGYAKIRVNAGADTEDWWKRIFVKQIRSCTQKLYRLFPFTKLNTNDKNCCHCIWICQSVSIHLTQF